MGLLTDLVIAPSSDAAAVSASLRPADRWPCLELKRLDTSKLAALALAWNDPAQAAALEGDDCMAAGGDDGPWVFELPAAFRDRLAQLGSNDVPVVAASWAEQDEPKFDGWTAPDLEVLLGLMQPFAADAVKAGMPLLLWVAL